MSSRVSSANRGLSFREGVQETSRNAPSVKKGTHTTRTTSRHSTHTAQCPAQPHVVTHTFIHSHTLKCVTTAQCLLQACWLERPYFRVLCPPSYCRSSSAPRRCGAIEQFSAYAVFFVLKMTTWWSRSCASISCKKHGEQWTLPCLREHLPGLGVRARLRA